MAWKKKVTLSLDSKVYSDFQKYCEENAIMLSKKIELLMKKIVESKGRKFLLIGILFILLLNLVDAAGYKPVGISTYYLHNENDSQYGTYFQMKNSSTDSEMITSNSAQLINNLVTCWNSPGWLAPSWNSQTIVNGTWNFSIYTNTTSNFAVNQYFLSAKIIKRNSSGEFNPLNTSWVGFAISGGTAPAPRNWSYNVSFIQDFNLSKEEKIGVQICVKVTGGGASNKYGYMFWEKNATSYVIFPSQSLEDIPPNFSNYAESPFNGSAYSFNRIYRFNVSVGSSSEISKVWIEFNGINYTDDYISNISDVYMFNITNLGVGTYSYNWWANDSYGNLNSSELRYYTIGKADPSSNMNITGTSPVTYGATSDFFGSETNNGDFDCVYSLNETNKVFGAGTWIFNYSTSGCYNYTAGSVVKNLVVNKADNSLILLSSAGWNINYGTETMFSCSASYGNPNLYINNTEVSNPITITLAAGSHNIKCNISESQNYSAGLSSGVLTINKADSNCQILFNTTTPQTYPYKFKVFTNCDSAFTLFRNGTSIINDSEQELGAGMYNFTVRRTDTQNYSNIGEEQDFTINKANSQTSLMFDKTSPQIYGNLITPMCSVVSGVGSPVLRMNGNVISSGIALNLGAGDYNFNCSLNASQNYTYSENVSGFTINQASAITNVSVNPISPITYGTASNFSCLNSNGFGTTLYINGINKSEEAGFNIVRAAGNYIVNCSYFGNQNYSSSSEQVSYTIYKAGGDIKLYLNSIEDNLTVDYPEQYNITATTLYGYVSIYMDGNNVTINNGLNITPSRNEGYYNITAISSGDENRSFLSITRWLNVTLDVIPPYLEIVSPQDGGTYGYNESLPLNYSVADKHLESCWYNIDNGSNITAESCQNTSFNISNDGSYTLYFYANDSLGNLIERNVTFSVLVGSPTITLNSPIGIYLNMQNVAFRYMPSDLDLVSCELWGDFTGIFALNQTNVTPISDSENVFYLNLSDGIYRWNIRCNDSIGHSVFNGNKTFYVDTTKPVITISEPKGKKSSWIGIPLIFAINDQSPVNCKYNVNWAVGGNIIPNTSIANCAPTFFNLSSVGDYVISLFVSDYSGNSDFNSSSFSVDTSTPVSPPPGDGSSGGGGGGGGAVTPLNKTIRGELEISKLSDIVAQAGSKKTFSSNARNIGKIFLNNCRLIFKGEVKSWFNSKQIQGISPGENVNFVFDLSIPEEISSGDYNTVLYFNCDEANKSQNLKITIPGGLYTIKIKELKHVEGGLDIIYSFEESNFTTKDISIDIWIVDENGIEINRIKDNFINENQVNEREVLMELPDDLIGIHTVYFALSSDLSNYVKQSVVLGKSVATSLTILDNPTNKMIAYVIFVLIVGGAVLFIMWGRNKKSKMIKEKIKIRR